MFVASAIDLEPTQMSAAALLARLASPGAWSEGSVHPPEADFPRLGIEVHPGIGVSILCHENERSIGFLAATRESLSPPSILVNLGGQVIERWPVELFLAETGIWYTRVRISSRAGGNSLPAPGEGSSRRR